jgi:BTB/POZ domain
MVIIHRLVRSSALRGMLIDFCASLHPSTDDMLERNKDVVELHEIDAPSLNQLIDFAYTGEIIITEENVQVLLPASSLLQIQSVREACCKFLLRQLHPSNVLGIRSFAGDNNSISRPFFFRVSLARFCNFRKFSSAFFVIELEIQLRAPPVRSGVEQIWNDKFKHPLVVEGGSLLAFGFARSLFFCV